MKNLLFGALRKMHFGLKKFFWLLVPFLIWWSLKNTPLNEVWISVSRLTVGRIFILFWINIFIMLALSLRWMVVIRSQGYRIPLRKVFLYRLSGIGFSYFTPGLQVGGEPFQVYLLTKREGISSSGSISTVALDKLIEIGTKSFFLMIGLLAILHFGLIRHDLQFLVIFFLAFILIFPFLTFLALHFGYHPLTLIFNLLPHFIRKYDFFQKIGHLVLESEAKMGEFCKKQPRTILLTVFISAAAWSLIIFEFWLSLFFLGVNLDFWHVLGILTAARFAFLIPIPAGLGTLEASQVFIMTAFGLNPALGLALSLIIRGRDLLFGISGLLLGYSFIGNLKKAPRKEKQEIRIPTFETHESS